MAASALAQPAKAWTRNLGLTVAGDTYGQFVARGPLGTVFVAKLKSFRPCEPFGYVEVNKLSATGAVVWTANFYGRGRGMANLQHFVSDAIGNVVVVTGEQDVSQSPMWTVSRLSGMTGATLWTQTAVPVNFFAMTDIGTDAGGNVFFGGQGVQGADARIAVCKFAAGNGTLLWTKTVSRTAVGVSDTFYDLAVDAANNVAVAGIARTSNYCILDPTNSLVAARLNGATGATLWATTFSANASDKYRGPHVATDSLNNVIVAATAERSPRRVWVMTKRSSTSGGALLNRVQDPVDLSLGDLKDLAIDGANGTSFSGEAVNTTFQDGVCFFRLDSGGTTSFRRMILDWKNSADDDLNVTNPVSMAAVGTSALTCAYQKISTKATVVSRLNLTTGATVWEKTYSGAAGSDTVPRGLCVTTNNDTAVAISVEPSTALGAVQGGALCRSAAAGNVVFNHLPGNAVVPTPEFGANLVFDASSNVYTVGGSAGRIVTEKVSSAGALVWQNVYENAALDKESSILAGGRFIGRDGAGNIYVLGTHKNSTVLQKINSVTGVRAWATVMPGLFGFSSPGRNMAVTSGGDVYVPLQFPSTLVKVKGLDGSVLWTATVDGPGAYDVALYAATDTAGNPFVAGVTTDLAECPNTNSDRVFVERFNPTTGAKLWLTTLTPPVPGYNDACGLAVGPNSYIIVGGSSFGGATKTDFFTSRLATSNGAVSWTTRHDLGNVDQSATAMIMDSSTNVVLTGSTVSGTAYNGWTVKVLNSTGARSWTRLLTTPAGSQRPFALARDGANNIYVGGLAVNGTNVQLFGQKLAAATGAQTWQALSAGAAEVGIARMAVGVNAANRMHLLGSIVTPTSMTQQTLIQYNP